MIYDQYSDMSEIHAPVQARIVIRSKSNNNIKDDGKSTSTGWQRNKNNKNYTSASGQRVDLTKFTQRLQNITARTSSQACAKSIRIALESAGARFNSHPVAAADWGGTLTKIGYKKIEASFDHPKKGDIYIIHRTNSHVYGHIAGYSGANWVSDFRQNGYAVYRNENVNYSYYRMAD